ncbi:MAG: rhodanese-like domain-containing protein [Betaproteobacteria bacterium]|nr:rhodanese-like domain-containing protein [Betaproteobacteria bacterium]MDE2423397.1 rhodanese-like domain-containing protein [Betaproteobacteria bacterium]
MGLFSNLFSAGETPEFPANALIIDVRSQAEFASGHVDGAVNLPLDEFNAGIQKLVPQKDTPVILCCLSGGRSGHACSIMKQQGYKAVFNGGGAVQLAQRLKKELKRKA